MSGTLEVCIDRLDAIATCVDGGADRIELCAALALGGVTPSVGAMRAAAACPLPVHALIRPRAGNFVFDRVERRAMLDDVAAARVAGLAGVVIGAAREDGQLDRDTLAALRDAGCGLSVTLHRVIDTLADPLAALDVALELGVDRVLSSGGTPCARDGADVLVAMHAAAGERLEIVAGAGLSPSDVGSLGRTTGIRAFHGSCSTGAPGDKRLQARGLESERVMRTELARVRAMRAAVDALEDG